MTDKEKILNLKDGESYIVPESDYGLAEIWLKNEWYILFAIPTFGGMPSFHDAFRLCDIDKMIKEYESWT